MAKATPVHTFTVTLPPSITSSQRGKALDALAALAAKYGAIVAMGNAAPAIAVPSAPAIETPRVYDVAVGTVKEREALTVKLDALRGPGMVKRMAEAYKIAYVDASRMATAERAAHKAGSTLMGDAKTAPAMLAALRVILAAK